MPEDQKSPPGAAASTSNQRRKTLWQVAARRLLQAEMAKHGYVYKTLARDLGAGDSEQSLMTRINRGTFSVAFFLEALRVMGTKSIDISHLPDPRETAARRK
ncbi:hypothetical protein RAMLITH_22880 [Ramlibacter sp. RBP-2]|uniref:DUF6471 domain-containing protein n=1 Tax=Ramlibacter lithotrophicus TaxID=2606681 RepID=A0A7X6DK54_9BURK|nr:DUF6471 domain-containing protein [Ramlibacter lithotrophicus]NKE68671.1 hypothetical protein [Ramlibacter lithotrophicus]